MSDNGKPTETKVYLIRLYDNGEVVAEAPFIVHNKELAERALKANIAAAVTHMGPQSIGVMFSAFGGPQPNVQEHTGLRLQWADKEKGHD